MRFISFEKAYLPNSDNMTVPVKCIVNVAHISLILPLSGDISDSKTTLTVAGQNINVPETPDEIATLLGTAVVSSVVGA